jgi:hypothetical protein
MPSSTYKAWTSMRSRCRNPLDRNYPNYGGRGIAVCKEWDSYDKFKEDMGEQPEGSTLERIDNDKGYYKGNCKWATHIEQGRNRRLQSNNTSGIKGVQFEKRDRRWRAFYIVAGNRIQLYSGKDFFEACCARKSYEAYLKGL